MRCTSYRRRVASSSTNTVGGSRSLPRGTRRRESAVRPRPGSETPSPWLRGRGRAARLRPVGGCSRRGTRPAPVRAPTRHADYRAVQERAVSPRQSPVRSTANPVPMTRGRRRGHTHLRSLRPMTATANANVLTATETALAARRACNRPCEPCTATTRSWCGPSSTLPATIVNQHMTIAFAMNRFAMFDSGDPGSRARWSPTRHRGSLARATVAERPTSCSVKIIRRLPSGRSRDVRAASMTTRRARIGPRKVTLVVSAVESDCSCPRSSVRRPTVCNVPSATRTTVSALCTTWLSWMATTTVAPCPRRSSMRSVIPRIPVSSSASRASSITTKSPAAVSASASSSFRKFPNDKVRHDAVRSPTKPRRSSTSNGSDRRSGRTPVSQRRHGQRGRGQRCRDVGAGSRSGPRSRRRSQDAGDQSQQGRLPGTVRAADAGEATRCPGERDVVEHDLSSESDARVRDPEHLLRSFIHRRRSLFVPSPSWLRGEPISRR